jgi:hypothetical protein
MNKAQIFEEPYSRYLKGRSNHLSEHNEINCIGTEWALKVQKRDNFLGSDFEKFCLYSV